MSRLKLILACLGVLLLVLVGAAALMFRDRTEEIPEALAEIDPAEADPMAIRIPDDEQPELALAELKGSRVVLMLEDKDSWRTKEGRLRGRAFNRWILPEDVKGYFVTDLDGLGLFKGKITEIMGAFRPEMRYPAYLDFEGAMFNAFKLPRGHSGLVILDADSSIVFRHSGPLDEAKLAEVKALVGAEEPASAPAPAFVAGDLSNTSCAGKICVLAFLGAPVRRADVPGGEGGFRGDPEAGMENFAKPEVRVAGIMLRTDEKVDRDGVEGVLIGALDGFAFKHWLTAEAEAGAEARAAFEIGDEESGVVVIDKAGNTVFRETGVIRFYQFGTIADHIGVEDIEDGSEEHQNEL